MCGLNWKSSAHCGRDCWRGFGLQWACPQHGRSAGGHTVNRHAAEQRQRPTRSADGAAIPLQTLDRPRPLVEVVAPAQCNVSAAEKPLQQEEYNKQGLHGSRQQAHDRPSQATVTHRLPVHCSVAVMECRRNLVCRSCRLSSIWTHRDEGQHGKQLGRVTKWKQVGW